MGLWDRGICVVALVCAAGCVQAAGAQVAGDVTKEVKVERVAAVAGPVPIKMHSPGRLLKGKDADGQVDYASQWPGSYFEAVFRGREIYFRVGESREILHVVVDEQTAVVLTKPEAGLYKVLVEGDGTHEVKVLVATESQSAANHFGGFEGVAGAVIPPSKALVQKRRQIEFIGDSHTVGYGDLSAKRECTEDEVWALTDDTAAFGARLAAHYNAEYQVNAISGRGVVRNYDGFAADKLPEAYPYVLFDKKQLYRDAAWQPGVIVIALGTNDFSTPLNAGEKWKTRDELHADYEATYVRFVQGLRARNPQAHFVLWATDAAHGEVEAEEQKVVARLMAEGETRIAFVAVDGLGFGACHAHPSLADETVIAGKLMVGIEAAGGGR